MAEFENNPSVSEDGSEAVTSTVKILTAETEDGTSLSLKGIRPLGSSINDVMLFWGIFDHAFISICHHCWSCPNCLIIM